MDVKSLIKWVMPTGIMEGHRRRFRLSRMGVADRPGMEEAAEACHYEIWPAFLRTGQEPWTLVDVGANDGDFIAGAQAVAPIARVYAFEPLPACHGKLRQVLASNPKSTLFPGAVGARPGEIEINFTGDSKMSSVLPPDPAVASDYQKGDFQVREKIKVPLTSLDTTLPPDEEFGLLKIDVQGFEMEVLNGATSVLSRTRAVMLEANYVRHYQGGVPFDDVFAWLHARKFRLSGVSAPYMGAAGPLWADAIFVRA